MMKKLFTKSIFIILNCAMLVFTSIAQFNYDFNWYNGDGHFLYGPPRTDVNLMNFRNFKINISHDTAALGFNGQNITFSNKYGQLLFYSNGCELRNRHHQLIDGSDPLLPGNEDGNYCTGSIPAMVQPESMLVIPFEGHDTSYYYIYQQRDTVMKVGEFDDGFGQFREHLVIGTNDSLFLVYKDKAISNKYNYDGFTTAVKHQNNSDWWLIYPLYRDSIDQFESILIAKNGTAGIDNNVHSSYNNPISNKGRSSGQLAASPDGEKLAMFRSANEFMTFSFNRSTGKIELETRDTMPWVTRWPFTPPRGLCYSPNGRYLYAGVDSILYQLDSHSPNFPFDTVRLAQSFGTNFSLMQMGPDCKIYSMIIPGGDAYHVIHRPNEKGKDCMVELKGAEFPTDYQLTIPLFPNYRLGTPEENWCDSIFDDTTSSSYQLQEQQKKWQLWPNPADEYVKIAHEDGNFGLKSVEIYTFQGQMLKQRSFAALNITYEMNVSDLPEGMYMLKIQPKVGREEWHKVVVF